MRKTNVLSSFLLILLIGMFSGCDQIKAIKEYFVGNKTTEEKNVVEDNAGTTPETLGANELARIGKWAITVAEFDERMKALKEALKERNPNFNTEDPETKKIVLQQLVQQELIYQDAERKGLTKSQDIQKAIEEFRRQIVVQQSLAEMVKGIVVTEEDLKTFYDQNKEKIIEPGDWHLLEIRVDTKKEADQIRKEIMDGEDFAQTAKQKSKSASASSGGDLGFVGLAKLPFPGMAQELLNLKEGKISEVFEGPDGFYIVKNIEQKKGRQMTLEEVKDELKRTMVYQKQQEAMTNYLQKLSQETKPQINQELLKK